MNTAIYTYFNSNNNNYNKKKYHEEYENVLCTHIYICKYVSKGTKEIRAPRKRPSVWEFYMSLHVYEAMIDYHFFSPHPTIHPFPILSSVTFY